MCPISVANVSLDRSQQAIIQLTQLPTHIQPHNHSTAGAAYRPTSTSTSTRRHARETSGATSTVRPSSAIGADSGSAGVACGSTSSGSSGGAVGASNGSAGINISGGRFCCAGRVRGAIGCRDRLIIGCCYHRAMRTKNFLIILCCVVLTSLLLLLFSPAGQHNDSFNSLMSQTHQQLQEFHVSVGGCVQFSQLSCCDASRSAAAEA